jgi:3-keto-disaccharide hydrolase
MTNHLLICGAALALCGAARAADADNKPPAGFTALFNGKDLSGWQAAIPINKRLGMTPDMLATEQKKKDDAVLPHWVAEDGVLVNDGKGDNLATVKHYRNFELMLDWKIEPKGDSGVYLRGIPQVQIWDSDSLDQKRFALEYGKGSGALWNNPDPKDKVPLKRADKPAGEWNSFHIVMKGDKVTVKLNGELVVDNVTLANVFEKGKPLTVRGPIELQRHPKQDGTLGKLWFKNVYIKELPDE